MEKKGQKPRRFFWRLTASLVLAAVGIGCFGIAFWQLDHMDDNRDHTVSSGQRGEELAWSAKQVKVDYPVGKLVVTQERKTYEDGLQLVIPAMGLDEFVMADTEESSLQQGPGLYEYAQLPEASINANVSIAGHRDLETAPFYTLDQLGEGDLFYLLWEEMAYVYRYEDTQIITPDDWGPIACREYPCLTLTSCEPVGSSQKRIVVTGELIDVCWEEDLGGFSQNEASYKLDVEREESVSSPEENTAE